MSPPSPRGQSLLPPLGSMWSAEGELLSVGVPRGGLLLVVGLDPPWVEVLAGDRRGRLRHWAFGQWSELRRVA